MDSKTCPTPAGIALLAIGALHAVFGFWFILVPAVLAARRVRQPGPRPLPAGRGA